MYKTGQNKKPLILWNHRWEYDKNPTDFFKVLYKMQEKNLNEYMKWDAVNIEIDLNIGEGKHTVYTCDFTHDYIDINSDYRRN